MTRWIRFGLLALLIIVIPSATHAAITRSLSIGSQGSDVLDLQELLRSKGYFSYPVSTGYFGPSTAQAVAKFQLANGLSPVGNVGPQTRAVINGGGGATATASTGTTANTGSTALPTLTRSLGPGSSGSDVLALQTALKSKGLLSGTPTGVYDAGTVSAVLAFQAQNNLETVGRVGPQTRAIVNQIIASLPATGSGSGTTVATTGGTASTGSTGTTVPSVPNVPNVPNVPTTPTTVTTSSGSGGGGGTPAPNTGTTVTTTTTGTTTTPQPAAPTLTLTSSTTTLPSSGGSVILTWSSANASSCTASGGWTGSQATSGTRTIQGVVRSTDFTLTCTGNSQTVVKTASVTVVAVITPQPTVTLGTSASSVVSGGNATLTWSSTNATSCTASGGWSGAKNTSGTQALTNLTSTSQYTLACSGAGGSASQNASITVTAPQAPPSTPVVSGSSTIVHNATELWNTLIALDGTGGTTVLLAAGNYGDVTIGAWNKGFNYPQTVTVTSQDASNRAVLHSLIVQNSSGITFSNFNVTGVGSNAYAIYSNNSSNITYGGLKVAGPDMTGVGIFSRGDSNITITNNDIGNYGVGISAFQGYGSLAITRNNVHDVENDGIDIYDGAGLVLTPNVSENYVHDFVPAAGDHPDGIQFAAFNGTVTPTVKDNLVTRGFRAGGALPPQGIFISDGPLYSNPIVTGNLAVGTLYNGIALSYSNGGTMSNNTVISFPDYGSWIRYEEVANLTISNNLAGSYVTTSVSTNVALSNNTTTNGVADMTAAQPFINAWRASHPNVPTDSFQPVLALGKSPVTPITRTLAIGATGNDVTTLQRVLKSLGLFNTDATGYLGNVTKNAVTAFQKQNQLAAVGVVGPQTRALINSLLSSIKLPF